MLISAVVPGTPERVFTFNPDIVPANTEDILEEDNVFKSSSIFKDEIDPVKDAFFCTP